jgi:xanthine dehydrogenase accessory factor
MDVLDRILDLIDAQRYVALAVILSTEGSTPRKAGTCALLDHTGRIWGTIGGGALEAEVQKRARHACDDGRPCVVRVGMHGTTPAAEPALCGGAVRVLIDPTVAAHRSVFAAARTALGARRRGAIAVSLSEGGHPTVRFAWRPADCPARPAHSPAEETILLPVVPNPLAVIVGGGHVGQAVAVQARLVGFDIAVIDDRPEFVQADRFPPGTTFHCGPTGETLGALPVTPDTYIVIVTRDHRHDGDALAACIHRPAGYLGMIGSRRKVAVMRQAFLEAGTAGEAEFDRLHAPIGLAIGAETVPEIATSIVAELIAVRRGGDPRANPPEA